MVRIPTNITNEQIEANIRPLLENPDKWMRDQKRLWKQQGRISINDVTIDNIEQIIGSPTQADLDEIEKALALGEPDPSEDLGFFIR